MTFPVRFVILLLLTLLPTWSVTSAQIRTFQSSAIAPILENDIAFAKHNAFLQAQRNIIEAAIQELLEPTIYEENRKRIHRSQSLIPKNHLVSVKIINEYVEEGEFSIELEAKIQIGTLIDDLKQLGLVFKSDPWFPITLLTEMGIDANIDLLRDRLAPFHIEIDTSEKVDFTGISTEERSEKTFIEDLFLNFPRNKIIYLLETVNAISDQIRPVTESDQTRDTSQLDDNFDTIEQINGVQLRIVRKSDLEELNTFTLKMPAAYTAESSQLKEEIEKIVPRLFSLLTINSIKRNTYDSGLAASYYVEVSGLNAPYLRSAFELQVLRKRQFINHFSLVQLSVDTSQYVIQSSSELDVLIKELLQPNPYFELLVEKKEFNTIGLSAFYQYTATGIEPNLWLPDEKTLSKILDSLLDHPVQLEKEKDNDKDDENENESAQLNSYYIPSFIETEPNNSTNQYNRIPESTYILGEIASRADEDIFELKSIEISDDQLEMELFPDKFADMDLRELLKEQIRHSADELQTSQKGLQSTKEESNQTSSGSAVPAKLPMTVGQNATIYIDWIQIGKTSLAPQLKLYDESFNFINAFNLARSQKRMRFNYTFAQAVPEKIYIRIADRIGFIQGETGGFKRYQYLIRYSWSDEKETEPESPLADEIELLTE